MKLNAFINKFVAVIISIGLVMPSPAYAARQVSTGNSASAWDGLVAALTGTPSGLAGLGAGLVPDAVRSEARLEPNVVVMDSGVNKGPAGLVYKLERKGDQYEIVGEPSKSFFDSFYTRVTHGTDRVISGMVDIVLTAEQKQQIRDAVLASVAGKKEPSYSVSVQLNARFVEGEGYVITPIIRSEARQPDLKTFFADKVVSGVSWKAIDPEVLKVPRAFGTNGIRGTGFNVDELRRMTAATAVELIAEWNKDHAGEPLPVLGVAVDPRPQGEEGFSEDPGKKMAYARAKAEVLASFGFKIRFYNKPVGSGHMIATTSKDYPAEQRNFAVLMGTASHNEVVDPKTGTLQFGLKVFKGNAPIMDDLAGRISRHINGDEKAGIPQVTESPVLNFDAAVKDGRIEVIEDPAAFEVERLDSIFNLAELGRLLRKKFPQLRYAFNTMNGGMSKVDPLIVQRMGFHDLEAQVFNTTFMNDPAMKKTVMEFVPDASGNPVRFAPDPTRKWFRGAKYDEYVAGNPQNTIGLLIDGDADRLVLEQMGEISPNQIGPLAKYYLRRYAGDTVLRYKDARTVPTTSALDLLDQAFELPEPEVTDVGSKNFVPFLNDFVEGSQHFDGLQVGLEESGHVAVRYKGQVFFDHPVALQLLMLRMMADTGKTWRELESEMWQFITEKTGVPKIVTSRTGISKDEGAESYYPLLAKLPKDAALRQEFGEVLAREFKAAGLDVTLKGFDTRAPGGVQFHFSDHLRVMPRKSGTDGSVRFYFESPEPAVALLSKSGTPVMKKVLDQFLKRSEARAVKAESEFPHVIPTRTQAWKDLTVYLPRIRNQHMNDRLKRRTSRSEQRITAEAVNAALIRTIMRHSRRDLKTEEITDDRTLLSLGIPDMGMLLETMVMDMENELDVSLPDQDATVTVGEWKEEIMEEASRGESIETSPALADQGSTVEDKLQASQLATFDWEGGANVSSARRAEARGMLTGSSQEPLVVSADFAFDKDMAGLPLVPALAAGNPVVVLVRGRAEARMVESLNAQLPAGAQILIAQSPEQAVRVLRKAIDQRVRRGLMKAGARIRAIVTSSSAEIATLKRQIGDQGIFIATKGWLMKTADRAGLAGVVQRFAGLLALQKSA